MILLLYIKLQIFPFVFFVINQFLMSNPLTTLMSLCLSPIVFSSPLPLAVAAAAPRIIRVVVQARQGQFQSQPQRNFSFLKAIPLQTRRTGQHQPITAPSSCRFATRIHLQRVTISHGTFICFLISLQRIPVSSVLYLLSFTAIY